MVFAHDTELSLISAVELVNTASEPDTMTTIEELDEYFERWDYTGRYDRTLEELAGVRDVRRTLRALLTSERDQAAALVNQVLAEAHAVPQLMRHGEWDWHVHAVADDAPLATRIAVETAMAMSEVVREDEMSRLAICADEECDGVVLDLSRNRSKRFCSTACGNRNAVAAYRARQAAED